MSGSVSRRSEHQATNLVFAGALSLLGWLGVYVALSLTLTFVVVLGIDQIVETAPALRYGIVAVWGGAAMALATRVAAGVLDRRGVDSKLWLLAVPAVLVAYDLLGGLSPGEPVWPSVLLGAVALGGSVFVLGFWKDAGES